MRACACHMHRLSGPCCGPCCGRGLFQAGAVPVFSAIGQWGHVQFPTKLPGKMALIRKSGLRGNFRDAVFRMGQGMAGSIQPDTKKVLLWSLLKDLFEAAVKLAVREMDQIGQFLNPDWLRMTIYHSRKHFFHAVVGWDHRPCLRQFAHHNGDAGDFSPFQNQRRLATDKPVQPMEMIRQQPDLIPGRLVRDHDPLIVRSILLRNPLFIKIPVGLADQLFDLLKSMKGQLRQVPPLKHTFPVLEADTRIRKKREQLQNPLETVRTRMNRLFGIALSHAQIVIRNHSTDQGWQRAFHSFRQ